MITVLAALVEKKEKKKVKDGKVCFTKEGVLNSSQICSSSKH